MRRRERHRGRGRSALSASRGRADVSSTAGEGAFYPALEAGRSGLHRRSFALVDQVRSIDKRRITTVFGKLGEGEIAIDEGLILFLGLD